MGKDVKRVLLILFILLSTSFSLFAYSIDDFNIMKNTLNFEFSKLFDEKNVLKIISDNTLNLENEQKNYRSVTYIFKDKFKEEIYMDGEVYYLIGSSKELWQIKDGKKQLMTVYEELEKIYNNWWEFIDKSNINSFQEIVGYIYINADLKPYKDVTMVCNKGLQLLQLEFSSDDCVYSMRLKNYMPLEDSEIIFPRETVVYVDGVSAKSSRINKIEIVEFSDELFEIDDILDKKYSFKDSLKDFWNNLF